MNPERWTVADLMRWWLDTYSRRHAAHGSNECHFPVFRALLKARTRNWRLPPQDLPLQRRARRCRDPSLPTLRAQALAEGERPRDPLPRHEAHLRERPPHAQRPARLGAEAPRALDRKITERRYGHLLPDFMKSEVDRLRFGIDRLVSEGRPSTTGRSAALYAQGERMGSASQRMTSEAIRRLRTGWDAAWYPPLYPALATQKKRPEPRRFREEFRPHYWRGVPDSNPWPPA